ncbi:MAG: flagellar basal body rod C-terminal domain-containing protein, partial [Acetivibrio sp.]
VTTAIVDDPKKIACAEYNAGTDTGIEDKTVLNKLLALKSDMNMFKQGTPNMFLQTMVAEIAIDTKTSMTFAKSQENILKVVNKQRMSISGVDSDEEAMDLIKFRNAYDLCSKVISTMNQIYDKLINGTGV